MEVYSCRCLTCGIDMDLTDIDDMECTCGGRLIIVDRYDFYKD